ncbi:phage replication initiation protein [Paenibacillus algorifonticola]|uniref:Phage replication initiation protein n=1 Tax=Paenibacillus algorifonticola TaxID=684063 RepID=A0A1I2J4Y5_9BACL|nr:replication initiation factor domain-containing protein [Paenibacillus algorifonticola]SFF49449.1 phage replication initiation protein [Paenibacillus algorifonticola]
MSDEQQREHLIVLVDWASFTLKGLTLTQVFELIGIPESEFVDLPRGLHFYAKQKICGDIRVLWESTTGMDLGIHVQMSGQGCREYETFYNGDWYELFAKVINNGGKFSRFDLAADEFRYNGEKPYYTVNQLIRKVKRGEARSKWKNLNRMEKIRISDGLSQGDTAYFGSALSDIQLRVYEKNKERENAGKQLEEHLTVWNRAELELKDDRAQDAVAALLYGDDGGLIFFRLVKNYLNFVDRGCDSNKARWPVCDWWLDYLGEVERLQLSRQAPDKTIEQKEDWVNRQVNPTLAEIWYAHGSPGPEMLWDMISDGLERMTDAQVARATDFQNRKRKEAGEHLQRRIERRAMQLEFTKDASRTFVAELAKAHRQNEDSKKEPFAAAPSNDPRI